MSFRVNSIKLFGVQGGRRRGRPRKRWAVEVYRFVTSMAGYDRCSLDGDVSFSMEVAGCEFLLWCLTAGTCSCPCVTVHEAFSLTQSLTIGAGNLAIEFLPCLILSVEGNHGVV